MKNTYLNVLIAIGLVIVSAVSYFILDYDLIKSFVIDDNLLIVYKDWKPALIHFGISFIVIIAAVLRKKINIIIRQYCKSDNLKDRMVDIIGSLVIMMIYSILAITLMPEGVNTTFATKFLSFIIPALAVSSLLLGCIFLFTNSKRFLNIKKPHFKLRDFFSKDLLLIFLPVTPIIQYVILNQDILSIVDSMRIVLFFMALAFLIIFVIPNILTFFVSRNVLMIISLTFTFLLLNMASLTSGFNWHLEGNFNVQIAYFIIIFLILFVSYSIDRSITYIAVLLFFVLNVGLTLNNFDWDSIKTNEQDVESKILTLGKERDIAKPVDVLFIVYESYANYETLKHYGIDNTEQIKLLEKNDFKVYHGTYSLGAPTIPSLSAVFNVDKNVPPHRKFIAGSGAVQSLFRMNGYKTHCIVFTDFIFRNLERSDINYDYSFPASAHNTNSFIKSILAGEFSDEIALSAVSYENYLIKKSKVLNGDFTSPLFLYSHSAYPDHRPGSSQNIEEVDKYLSRYIERLHTANEEMKHDVAMILKNYPDAIVIFAGDHGPFLTKTGYGLQHGVGGVEKKDVNRLDMQDRYGTFLAIRWPEEKYSNKYEIKTLQDVFPAVFAFLFDDESFYDNTRMESVSEGNRTLGVYIKNGKIKGGKDDGKPLFKTRSYNLESN